MGEGSDGIGTSPLSSVYAIGDVMTGGFAIPVNACEGDGFPGALVFFII